MCAFVNSNDQMQSNILHITNAILDECNSTNLRQAVMADVEYLLYLGYSIYRTITILCDAINYKERM
tara:strand:+ start:8476 stop:8676 length:201 start_codon:yes stop_codon:yes gene_type:complete